MENNIIKKYVYVIFDPLYERVLCVHDKPNMRCHECKKRKYEKRNTYQLIETKHAIKTE
jgi:hypothetical protein